MKTIILSSILLLVPTLLAAERTTIDQAKRWGPRSLSVLTAELNNLKRDKDHISLTVIRLEESIARDRRSLVIFRKWKVHKPGDDISDISADITALIKAFFKHKNALEADDQTPGRLLLMRVAGDNEILNQYIRHRIAAVYREKEFVAEWERTIIRTQTRVNELNAEIQTLNEKIQQKESEIRALEPSKTKGKTNKSKPSDDREF